MNPKELNKKVIQRFEKYFEPLKQVEGMCSCQWTSNWSNNAKKYIMGGQVCPLQVTPLYYSGATYQQQRPHLFMVYTGEAAVITNAWDKYEEVRGSVVGVVKDNVLILMNVDTLYDDQYKALCAIIGGCVHRDATKFPLNPVRYTVDDETYPFASGMQITMPYGKTIITSEVKDYKVRSNRKVTIGINKRFKEYIKNARATAMLLAPEGNGDYGHYGWNDEVMSGYAQKYLNINTRLRWEGAMEDQGLILNPQKLFTAGRFDPAIDDDTGVITPTKNFDVPKLIIEAAKVDNFAPMAYLLLENSSERTEKRLLNAVRALEGGFKVGEI